MHNYKYIIYQNNNKYIDLTLGATGSTYTAVASGYVMFEGGSTSGTKYLGLFNDTAQFGQMVPCISGVSNTRIILPVKKGDKFHTTYTVDTSRTLRFVYAEGEI